MKKYNHVSQKMIYKMKVKWKDEKKWFKITIRNLVICN
jgi:hypothetical protein